MRYDVHGDTFSRGASAQILFSDIFSSRAFKFPLEGQSVSHVLVASIFLIGSLSDPNIDLM